MEEDTYTHIIALVRNKYLEYVMMIYKSIRKKTNNTKMDKGSKQAIQKKYIEKTNK